MLIMLPRLPMLPMSLSFIIIIAHNIIEVKKITSCFLMTEVTIALQLFCANLLIKCSLQPG